MTRAARTTAPRRAAIGVLALAADVACGAAVGGDVREPVAVARYEIVGDAIPAPLAPAGDPARGRALVVARESANCVLCHAIPDPAIRFHGDLGPSLAGVGARLSAAQLRLRIVDPTRIDRETAMPAYHRVEGLDRVAAAYRGKPVLSASEVEDLVAWLSTLR